MIIINSETMILLEILLPKSLCKCIGCILTKTVQMHCNATSTLNPHIKKLMHSDNHTHEDVHEDMKIAIDQMEREDNICSEDFYEIVNSVGNFLVNLLCLSCYHTEMIEEYFSEIILSVSGSIFEMMEKKFHRANTKFGMSKLP